MTDDLPHALGLSFRTQRPYERTVSRRSPEHWSLMRSLAFLAATFAIVFAALLPSAVAASAPAGEPVMMCSGDHMLVVRHTHGSPAPLSPGSMGGTECADCVLAALTTLPPAPPLHPAAPPRIAAVQPDLPRPAPPPATTSAGLPPPSTAPPTA